MTTANVSATSSSIDWNASIQLANNNTQLATELLGMFVSDLPNAREGIIDASQQSDYEKLLGQVHKLHGASCYCGVTRLKTLLGKMEIAVKEHADSDFQSLLSEFNNETSQVIEDYKLMNFQNE